MYFSIIIPTIGRDSLQRAVSSVLDQLFTSASFEVIVVNDSGKSLPEEPWMNDPRLTLVQTVRRERCVARNTGAAIAKGDYLFFLDDDDWLLQDALQNLWVLAGKEPDAAWLYGGVQIVDESGRVLAERNSGLSGKCSAQVLGGAWVPIQSSIIRSQDFFQVGGFNPSIIGTEDQDLCRRIAINGSFANTPAAIGCLNRGSAWATSTNYLRAAEDTRSSRNAVLNEPGIFRSLLSSINTAYWHGRVLRIYLSTINYNFRHRRFAKVISRLIYSSAVFAHVRSFLFSSNFWQGVRAEHVPDSLHFVISNLEREGH